MEHSTNTAGILEIGGVDVSTLKKEYGTPLYVYDVGRIRQNARAFVETFEQEGIPAQVAYASKAFSSVAMIQVADEEKLSLDVVSEGELYTALEAGFPVKKIHMHGNNKSRAELKMAVDAKIGCIVVDNFYEIALLEEILEEENTTMDVLLRVTPGIEAHTHDYILTGQEDSKFGFDLTSGQADRAFTSLLESTGMNVIGLHCHIGSQIFETSGFLMATRKLFDIMKKWKEEYSFEAKVLNLGGGFGIRYTEEDDPLSLNEYARALMSEVKFQSEKQNYPMPEIWIEPGRAIVGDAGITLYEAGSVKEIEGVRTYLSVDGGMTDNIRPALYDARYDIKAAERMNEEERRTYAIAGKCCESGDMLIWDATLPDITPGDTLAVFSTGAYGYSMSNNYNRFPKAAVVFVENGSHQLVIRRESFDEVTRFDLNFKTGGDTDEKRLY
ncbi:MULTISPECIES: diaminopimelate decarboxylase [Salimicrobium]|uniref:Diaminopimelate decarboxylase n=2 Tax=Salimicrobium TaxID=351195 RepID=K2FIW7_9BACI|nr:MULTISPECIES: diaminopimelate decarboxylase [Salimicrobium]AKG04372.1 diaminopimelate decarboxylase [Salimicrobium jeotgali]EKE31041.1 diaminopimelate decarboxylase [Salimicrobium jeotgali]MBM7697480.1 diaminopimelate decarboxylase [Salimicrobium jeotgali]SDX70863.1 diaminopimelate decarboxylase [Salimicrobium album]